MNDTPSEPQAESVVLPEDDTVPTASSEWHIDYTSNTSAASDDNTTTPTATDETRDSSTAHPNNGRSHKSSFVWVHGRRWIAVMIVLVAIIVGLVVPFCMRRANKDSPQDTAPVVNVNHARVQTFVLQQNWSDVLSLLDPTSPQTRAIHQLALENASLDNVDVVQQRYALWVVWFGLGMNVAQTSNEHECEWQSGVVCNEDRNVTGVSLSQKGLRGSIVEEISLLSQLEHLDLESNNLEGILPTALYSLHKLTTLQVSENNFISTLSSEIGRLTSLERLQLHDTAVSGSLPETLRAMSSLKIVQLWRTKLAGPILDYAIHWPNLRNLTIAENELFTGTIPTELGSLSQLHIFQAQKTSIVGTIPTEVGRMSNLERFAVGQVLLSEDSVTPYGTVPTEFGNCRNLSILAFDSTRLTGFIPSELGQLSPTLSLLWFRNCRMQGMLPDSLQSLTKLTALSLEKNSFTGTLPEWLGSLEELEYLGTFWNSFEGTVPISLCRETLQFLYDCDLSCDCCGPCGPVD